VLQRLRLSNFRRHAETEIYFPADGQVVLIAGLNGSGKTTLLEGIVFALYGESRHGKRGLDSLVRWGSEIEGLEVELDFEADGVDYQIKRKRIPGKSGKSTAVLYGNGNALVEGPVPVTAEITKIFGMDAQAFRLAVIAQQKELDGLASLRPAERAAQLSRLLRLDAVTRARDEARSIFRREREIVKSLGSVDDIDALRADVVALEAALAAANTALAESRTALSAIDTELTTTADVEAAYTKATTDLARAETTVQMAEQEVARYAHDLAGLVIPDPVPVTVRTMEELAAAATEVERQIVRGESAQQVAEQHRMLTAEHTRVATQLAQITARLTEVGSASSARRRVDQLEADHGAAHSELAKVRQQLSTLTEQAGAAEAEARLAVERLERGQALGANCDACGQEISEEHRHTQEKILAAAATAATEAKADIIKLGKQARATEHELVAQVRELDAALVQARDAARVVEQLERDKTDLIRRRDTYAAQLGRLELVEVDLEDLYARKAEIAVEVANAQQADAALRARETALTRKLDLDLALSTAGERLRAARAAYAAAAVDAGLEKAYRARREQLARRNAEQEMAAYWATETAVTAERLAAAEAAVARAEKALQRRRGHEEKAQAATNSSRLLSVVEDVLNTQIRPALEGSVSQMLDTLSEGRFSAVRVDDDYNLAISDDGKYRPLTEFSGGELDLVALAVRLSLASVVAERHGGFTGFLILDEFFGSQDAGRRESIMNALRNLRTTYGQILLISHVLGIEDAADFVINIDVADDEGDRVALARAA
jgi:exonuclease SbcC